MKYKKVLSYNTMRVAIMIPAKEGTKAHDALNGFAKEECKSWIVQEATDKTTTIEPAIRTMFYRDGI